MNLAAGILDNPLSAVSVLSAALTTAVGLLAWTYRSILKGRLVPRRSLEDILADRASWIDAYRISEEARRVGEETRRVQDEQLGDLLDFARNSEQVLRQILDRGAARPERPPGRR